MTRDELKAKFRKTLRGRPASSWEVLDDIIDGIVEVAVDEAIGRIADRNFERRSTERRVGFERKNS